MAGTELIAAAVTPFDRSGRLDLQAADGIVGHLLQTGVEGIYVGGTTGESLLQSADERADYLRVVGRAAAGRVKLIAQVGGGATGTALRLAAAAAEAGFDWVSSLPPLFYNSSPREIVNYYEALAEQSPLPLLVYHFPSQSGVALPDDLFAGILALDNVVGVKYTSNDLWQLGRLQRRAPEASYYFGFDELYLNALPLGVDGAIGSTFNVMAPLFRRIHAASHSGNPGEAARLQGIANDLIAALIETGVVAGLKCILGSLGVPAGQPRAPLLPPAPAAAETLLTRWSSVRSALDTPA